MTPDAFAKALVENNQLPLAIQDIRRAKALSAVLAKATVTDVSGRPVDLMAIEAQAMGMPGGFTEALDADE
jgi:trigger factor